MIYTRAVSKTKLTITSILKLETCTIQCSTHSSQFLIVGCFEHKITVMSILALLGSSLRTIVTVGKHLVWVTFSFYVYSLSFYFR